MMESTMIHLSETGLHAGRRLCFAQDGKSVHAVYAPLHLPEYRKTVCLECLSAWANEAYDEGDVKPDYIVTLRAIDAILSNDKSSLDEQLVAHLIVKFKITDEEAKAHVARRETMLKQSVSRLACGLSAQSE